MYYYNMILEPKANWDLDKQSWDIHAIPLDKQKLDELKKQNRMKTRKRKIEIGIVSDVANFDENYNWISDIANGNLCSSCQCPVRS